MFRFTIVLLASLLWVGCSAPAHADEPSARELFRRLPPTIFENTTEGLADEEKDELLEHGKSAFWEIIQDTFDSLDMLALPFKDTAVSVRVFRDKGENIIAVGTRGTPVCTIELWREDGNDRILPMPTPPEPPARDFFAPGNKLPADVEPSVVICLGEQGLEAQIVFWNASGMAHVPVDNEIRYTWNQGRFEKQITPKAKP